MPHQCLKRQAFGPRPLSSPPRPPMLSLGVSCLGVNAGLRAGSSPPASVGEGEVRADTAGPRGRCGGSWGREWGQRKSATPFHGCWAGDRRAAWRRWCRVVEEEWRGQGPGGRRCRYRCGALHSFSRLPLHPWFILLHRTHPPLPGLRVFPWWPVGRSCRAGLGLPQRRKRNLFPSWEPETNLGIPLKIPK